MSTGSEASIDLPGQRASVRQARQFVADSLAGLAAAVSAEDIDDMKLVVSELVTNAIEHGQASTVRVEVATTDHTFRLTVRGGRGFIPNPDTQRMAPPAQLSGRGLQIVRSLTDSMDIGGTDAEHEVVVVKHFAP